MKIQHVLLTVTVAMTLMSCNKMQFSDVSSTGQTANSIIPLDPVVPNPVTPPTTSFKMTSGACAADSSTSVVSCMNCQVPQVVQEPQLSKKAQALLDIMTLSCPVKNKSDLTSYVPTRAEILKKINRASESIYPDSARTAIMETTIAGLTDVNDDSLRQYMFSGLYYRPPYSDAFETYFGIGIAEAKATFCWYGDQMTGKIEYPTGVQSAQYLNCLYVQDPYSCKERADYIQAQTYRSQLENALKLSITNPYQASAPQAGVSCSWDAFEGDDMTEAAKVINQWQSEGRQVSMEIIKGGNIGQCAAADVNNLQSGLTVKIGSYKCQ